MHLISALSSAHENYATFESKVEPKFNLRLFQPRSFLHLEKRNAININLIFALQTTLFNFQQAVQYQCRCSQTCARQPSPQLERHYCVAVKHYSTKICPLSPTEPSCGVLPPRMASGSPCQQLKFLEKWISSS